MSHLIMEGKTLSHTISLVNVKSMGDEDVGDTTGNSLTFRIIVTLNAYELHIIS